MSPAELFKTLLFNEPKLQYLNKSQSASVGVCKIQCLATHMHCFNPKWLLHESSLLS